MERVDIPLGQGWTPIHNHPTRSGTTVHGKAALIFGVPFFGVGVFVVLLAMGVVEAQPGSLHAPPWVVGLAGGIFLLAGLSLLVHGALGLQRQKLSKRRALRFQREPWMIDHKWDPRGATDSGAADIAKMLWFGLIMVVFLAPFNWWAFLSEEGICFVQGFTAFFDLLLLWGAGYIIYLIIRRLKYGKTTLRYRTFPFFLGETFDAELSNTRGIGRYDKMTITLRCVQERFEVRKTSDGKSESVAAYCTWSDEHVEEAGELRAGDAPKRVTFRLPQGDYETRLLQIPPRYWELVACAETPGVDFQSVFLVPVYARPPGSTLLR